MRQLTLLLTLVLSLLASRCTQAAEPTLPELVDDLQNVSAPGYGYTGGRNGTEFLPYPGSGRFGIILFGGPGVTPSETMKKIVERGADAIPVLIKHLDDARPIKLAPVKGIGWTVYNDEYDFNRLNVKEKPAGVNRNDSLNRVDPREHALTVGDLCFVALGQIVNRTFTAARYQPTAGLAVNSPSYSKRLRTAIVKEWGKLTRDEHRQSLINDFLRPDHSYRQIGAYQRLAFYYPDVVEKLVVEELQLPTFDADVVGEFCEKELASEKVPQSRQQAFKAFVGKHGPIYAGAVQDELFDDLHSVEDDEDQTKANHLRQVLNELFQVPLNVKGIDAPYFRHAATAWRSELIESLVYDRSQAIGEKVLEYFLTHDRNNLACLRSLANRGYAKLLLEELTKIDVMANASDNRATEVLGIIATSRDPQVTAKLTEIAHSTRHAVYFLAVLPALGPEQSAAVLKSARVLLAKYADNDIRGTEELLQMIRDRYRKEAKEIFQEYLRSQDLQRAAIMGSVLWHGDPWAPELLAPYLDEQRDIPKYPFARRICDHVAQAISHGNKDLEFDTDWTLDERNKGIETIKAYCAKQNAAAPQPNK